VSSEIFLRWFWI